MLVAGIAGFKSWRAVSNPSAILLRDWLENASFTWLVTEDILLEYKEVLTRLGVRRNLIGAVINRSSWSRAESGGSDRKILELK